MSKLMRVSKESVNRLQQPYETVQILRKILILQQEDLESYVENQAWCNTGSQ
jgi:hypothetical protein